MERYSTVFNRDQQVLSRVRIGSRLKPAIVDGIIEKWQSMLDLIVKIIGASSGLIMKLNEDTIEVFLASNSEGNPYKRGEKEKLVVGLFCETVIGSQNKLHVPDATKSPVWKINNPDVNINMISYFGYPVNWPDREVFGTICILDRKEIYLNETVEELLLKVKGFIETDLKLLLLEQQLEQKNEQLEKALIVKDKFFSIIAHDLKSPFNTILGFSDVLVDQVKEKDFEGIDKYAAIIQQSSKRAFDLLMNLLEWSRAQTGKMDYNPEYFEMVSLIEDTCSLLDDNALQKSIAIQKQLPHNLPVFADLYMISAVLRNLISNAIKFTRSGGEIIVSAAETATEIVVSVKDNGVGISKERIEKIFSIGESESTPGTAKEKGTGLGLILCKEFVEKHGGRIWVESAEGKGSTFSFSIPKE